MTNQIKSLLIVLCCACLGTVSAQEKGRPAPKPLYRDPVQDGAADPVVIWNRAEKKWFMFYTNRRAKDTISAGESWYHGTRIGIAESKDGANWKYRDTADIGYRPDPGYTFWAPDVIEHDGVYHMYLSYISGIFKDWDHPHSMLHLTSKNLMKWKYESTLKLSSDKVIDASVMQLPDHTWRMWYNNERDNKSIYYANSRDLYHWTDGQKVVNDQLGEGPKVFKFKNRYWMITDVWNGMAVYTSSDLKTWTRQPGGNLLATPGKGVDDGAIGGHCDVRVTPKGRAYLFYFVHPSRGPAARNVGRFDKQRSSIQVTELKLKDGKLSCDRNEVTYIDLK